MGWWFFFFKQKTAYEIVSRDWSSDVCSSDLSDISLTLCVVACVVAVVGIVVITVKKTS